MPIELRGTYKRSTLMRVSACCARLLCLILSALLFIDAAAYGADDIPEDSVIILQRHACERHCPVYKLAVYGDGTVIYYGQYWVKKKGLVLSTIPMVSFRHLVEQARQIGYFDLDDHYGLHQTSGCPHVVHDDPIVSLTITIGTKSHGVIHRNRCEGDIPDKLIKFEEQVDSVTNSAQVIE